MNRWWPREAQDYASTVRAVLDSLGGVEAARIAEADPETRVRLIRPELDKLGLRGLDLWGEEAESAAAVLSVRAAGERVLPWPMASELALPPDRRDAFGGVVLLGSDDTQGEHADLADTWIAVDPFEGWRTHSIRPEPGATPGPLDPFSSRLAHCDEDPSFLPESGWQLGATRMLLDGFWVAGALDSIVRLTATHARQRVQFGTSIGNFGEVRWRIADMVMARDGLDELCLYTWFSLRRGRRVRSAESDVLALRVAMLEAASGVLTNGHQVLGAMGLCEEHDLTVIDRHLQPVLRRPAGKAETGRLLVEAVARTGFEATFPVEPWRAGSTSG